MEKTEFNLSEKIAHGNFTNVQNFIRTKDVKEFIKRLKEIKEDCDCGSCKAWIIAIDKLAGDELTK